MDSSIPLFRLSEFQRTTLLVEQKHFQRFLLLYLELLKKHHGHHTNSRKNKIDTKKLPARFVDFIDFILEKKAKRTDNPLKKRPLGLLKGKMKMSASFDEPLEDFNSYI